MRWARVMASIRGRVLSSRRLGGCALVGAVFFGIHALTAPQRPGTAALLLSFLMPFLALLLAPIPWQWTRDGRALAGPVVGTLQSLVLQGAWLAGLALLLHAGSGAAPGPPPALSLHQLLLARIGLWCFLWATLVGFGWVLAEQGATEARERKMTELVMELERLRAQDRRRDQDHVRLIRELQEALDAVQTLSGLIPICASCKKIRDDQGYWQQVEGYVAAHSKATFTHGLCPDCAREFLGEIRGPGLKPGAGDGSTGP
nr:hypothetical protein [uncultured Holophaga sp.]